MNRMASRVSISLRVPVSAAISARLPPISRPLATPGTSSVAKASCGGAIHAPLPIWPVTIASRLDSVGSRLPASKSWPSIGPWNVTKPA
ncbi:hypothetical protein G6F31_021476 [Rhizopus arrhizus]|nr:hypothetical protein G6F31_021476 [Rhizopus arrhizus]